MDSNCTSDTWVCLFRGYPPFWFAGFKGKPKGKPPYVGVGGMLKRTHIPTLFPRISFVGVSCSQFKTSRPAFCSLTQPHFGDPQLRGLPQSELRRAVAAPFSGFRTTSRRNHHPRRQERGRMSLYCTFAREAKENAPLMNNCQRLSGLSNQGMEPTPSDAFCCFFFFVGQPEARQSARQSATQPVSQTVSQYEST